MMKFSIVVPVYNTEKYIERCLNSILDQTYNNYEIIVVDDGSKDNSLGIIKEIAAKNDNIKLFSKKNSGVSDTRNFGVSKCQGDYLCFVDSDDYIEKNYLEKIKDIILHNNHPDLIKINYDMFDEKNNVSYNVNAPSFSNLIGMAAFKIFVSNSVAIDIPWVFVYSINYWRNHNYEFFIGTYHEDFRLMPVVLVNSNTVCAESSILYHYMVQRKGSIMTDQSNDFLLKKTDDVILHYQYLKDEIGNSDKFTLEDKRMFLHYAENNVIAKVCTLDNIYYKQYKNKLKKMNIYNLKNCYNLKNFIKKIILNINTKFYYKYIIK